MSRPTHKTSLTVTREWPAGDSLLAGLGGAVAQQSNY
jgi:hypothetical protein